METPAHKGKSTRADPLDDLKKIRKIQRKLAAKNSQRDNLLFILSINNGIRAGDILQLRYGQVAEAKVAAEISIVEQKTKKPNVIVINRVSHKVLKKYLKERTDWNDRDYLFPSREGRNKPITVQRFIQMVKEWARMVGVEGKISTHSLRKGFGTIQRKHYGVGFEVLARRYAHSSPAITMQYLGLSSNEVRDVLVNNVIGE